MAVLSRFWGGNRQKYTEEEVVAKATVVNQKNEARMGFLLFDTLLGFRNSSFILALSPESKNIEKLQYHLTLPVKENETPIRDSSDL